MQILNGRTSFFQWDLNQKLIISDDIHNEVHFAREGDDSALVLRVYEENGQRVVDVPNILLQTDGKIVAYMYGDNETESHTHFYKKFSVKKRPKPDDYVYTETEVINFNTKLDKNFGSENAGKALVIDQNGEVSPGDYAGGGGGDITSETVKEIIVLDREDYLAIPTPRPSDVMYCIRG